MSLSLGRVAAVHPEDHSVDVIMIRTGARLPGVQVLAEFATTNSGAHDLPNVSMPPSGDKWDLTAATDRDMIAVVGYIDGLPVVLGFLFPQVSQMLFADANRRVHRHASDWYTTVDGAGNFEAAHPSGTFLRVGETPDHEDLTGQDVDGHWAIAKNTTRTPHVRLVVANGGAVKADIHVDPSGNVTVTNAGNLSAHAAGTAAIQSDGDMTLTAPNINLVGNVAASGGALTHDGTNVGHDHTHGGVSAGLARTSGPG